MQHKTFATKFLFFLDWAEKFLSGKLKCITLCILKICSLSPVKLVLHPAIHVNTCTSPGFAVGTVQNAPNYTYRLRNPSYTKRNLC